MFKKIILLLLIVVLSAAAWVEFFPQSVLDAARWVEHKKAGVEVKNIVVEGENWPYIEGGPSDRPTLLLLHGFGGDKDNWTRMATYLTQDYNVVAPDLPGFGDQARHNDWVYDMPHQAERLKGFVAALKIDKMHIAGNSMGGNLAGLYAALNPEQVLSVAFINNSGVKAPNPSDMDRLVAEGINPLLVKSVADFDRMLKFIFVTPPPIPSPIKKYFAERAVRNQAFNRYIYRQYKVNRRGYLEGYLPQITQPTLVLWGRQDRVIDVSTIQTMKPLLSHETVIIMEDTGHVPMLEKPAETAGHYVTFLQNQQKKP